MKFSAHLAINYETAIFFLKMSVSVGKGLWGVGHERACTGCPEPELKAVDPSGKP